MRFEAIEEAKKTARIGNLSPRNELHYNDSHPELCAQNLDPEDIRREGALFNAFLGAAYRGFEPAHMPDFGKAHMVLNLWPGYGVKSTGFHFAHGLPIMATRIHSHPVTDECLILWEGKGQFYCGDRWVEAETFDCVLAPCGVRHQGKGKHAGGGLVWRRLRLTSPTGSVHGDGVLQERKVCPPPVHQAWLEDERSPGEVR